jgi:hypothetical protein
MKSVQSAVDQASQSTKQIVSADPDIEGPLPSPDEVAAIASGMLAARSELSERDNPHPDECSCDLENGIRNVLLMVEALTSRPSGCATKSEDQIRTSTIDLRNTTVNDAARIGSFVVLSVDISVPATCL